MKTFYARQYMAIDKMTLEAIWGQQRVAIHYPEAPDGVTLGPEDTTSLQPGDYRGRARGAMNALSELAREGGYVCAEYDGHDDLLIGKVQPGSVVEPFDGRWSDQSHPEGRVALLKTVRMGSARSLRPNQYAVIKAGRPRQGTLSRWPNAGRIIECLVDGTPIELSLDSLLPVHQEVLCGECLRSSEAPGAGLPRISHFLLPVGRTMVDIDILGITDTGDRVFAQVTHLPYEHAASKMERLRLYSAQQGVHLILFCLCEKPAVIDGVCIYPIQSAFTLFSSTSIGSLWLNQVLRPDSGGPDPDQPGQRACHFGEAASSSK